MIIPDYMFFAEAQSLNGQSPGFCQFPETIEQIKMLYCFVTKYNENLRTRLILCLRIWKKCDKI